MISGTLVLIIDMIKYARMFTLLTSAFKSGIILQISDPLPASFLKLAKSCRRLIYAGKTRHFVNKEFTVCNTKVSPSL